MHKQPCVVRGMVVVDFEINIRCHHLRFPSDTLNDCVGPKVLASGGDGFKGKPFK